MLQEHILVNKEWKVADMMSPKWDELFLQRNKTLDQQERVKIQYDEAALHHNETTYLKTHETTKTHHSESTFYLNEQGLEALRSSVEVFSV